MKQQSDYLLILFVKLWMLKMCRPTEVVYNPLLAGKKLSSQESSLARNAGVATNTATTASRLPQAKPARDVVMDGTCSTKIVSNHVHPPCPVPVSVPLVGDATTPSPALAAA